MPNEHTPPQTEAAQQLKNAANELFDFAIGREELGHIMTLLPEEAPVDHTKVEYELQILKIIIVGWSITYFLEAFPLKEPLAMLYWEAVREFSRQLSETTELMIGGDVNYFEVLRARLDFYVDALARRSDAVNPVAIAGDPAAVAGDPAAGAGDPAAGAADPVAGAADPVAGAADPVAGAADPAAGAADPAAGAADPAAVIGPAFADNCGAKDEVFTIMSGARMFVATTGRVRQMLEAVVQS